MAAASEHTGKPSAHATQSSLWRRGQRRQRGAEDAADERASRQTRWFGARSRDCSGKGSCAGGSTVGRFGRARGEESAIVFETRSRCGRAWKDLDEEPVRHSSVAARRAKLARAFTKRAADLRPSAWSGSLCRSHSLTSALLCPVAHAYTVDQQSSTRTTAPLPECM